ncbi:hypothetical protein GCM10025859_48790 [Alicyclobacillus fastidiosus]|nr:hypothetical protein GCM10025859_48790 [Alicyclobacillus fastidiosus]
MLSNGQQKVSINVLQGLVGAIAAHERAAQTARVPTPKSPADAWKYHRKRDSAKDNVSRKNAGHIRRDLRTLAAHDRTFRTVASTEWMVDFHMDERITLRSPLPRVS